MINLRQFRHFLAVLEHGSFLRASKAENISQPALSKSISALEDSYRVKLFKRQPRGVVPTTFAHELQFHARRILRDYEQSTQELLSIAEGSIGRVKVGVGHSFIPYVAKLVETFRERNPEAEFLIITDHANRLSQALLANRIDLFVGMTNELQGDINYTVTPAFADRYVGVCSPEHHLAGKQVEIDELLSYEWIGPELEESGRMAVDAYFISHQRKRPKFRVVTNITEIMFSMLQNSEFITILPEKNVLDGKFEELAQFYPKGFDFSRHVGIVRRAGSISTPLNDQFEIELLDLLR